MEPPTNLPPSNLPYADAVAPPARPGVVTAVAIIGIIFGGLGVLCLGGSTLINLAGFGKQAGAPQLPAGMMMFSMAMGIIGFLLSLMLLVGSIGMLSLSSWSRPMMIVWAVVDIIFDVVKLVGTLVFLPQTLEMVRNMQAAGAAQGPDPEMMVKVTRYTTIGTAALIFAITLGFALVVLLVLRKPNVQAAFEGGAGSGGSGLRPM